MKKYLLKSRIICDEIFEVVAENEHIASEKWLDGEGKYLYSLVLSSADINHRHPMYISEVQLISEKEK